MDSAEFSRVEKRISNWITRLLWYKRLNFLLKAAFHSSQSDELTFVGSLKSFFKFFNFLMEVYSPYWN